MRLVQLPRFRRTAAVFVAGAVAGAAIATGVALSTHDNASADTTSMTAVKLIAVPPRKGTGSGERCRLFTGCRIAYLDWSDTLRISSSLSYARSVVARKLSTATWVPQPDRNLVGLMAVQLREAAIGQNTTRHCLGLVYAKGYPVIAAWGWLGKRVSQDRKPIFCIPT